MPDAHVLVRNALRADPAVKAKVRDRVYAGSYPKVKDSDKPDVEMPAIRVLFPFMDPLSTNTTSWWRCTGQVDCHADTQVAADELLRVVLPVLLGLEGSTHEHGVIQAVTRWGVQSVEDGLWAPPKPQRIVAVTLTARAA